MSQRLYIGSVKEEERDFYDCVVSDAHTTVEDIRRDWLKYEDGYYLGPFKIEIGDLGLFWQITPTLEATFEGLNRDYPDDIWVFYHNGQQLKHPTKEELEAWLRS